MHGVIGEALQVEWRPLAELASIEAEWRALAARALEPNAFYEPAFALAAQPVFGRDTGAGLVWAHSTQDRLVGFFPARIAHCRYGIRLPVLIGWTHPYGPLGTPLIDHDGTEEILAAWFGHIAARPEWPNLLLMPFLPVAGPFSRALEAVLAARGGVIRDFGTHARALLSSREDGYLERALSAKKRKDLRRQRHQLAHQGPVSFAAATEPVMIVEALRDFLTIEARGWKGRAGTAAAVDPNILSFIHAAVSGLAAENKVRIDRLFVETRPIAAMVTLRSGAGAWSWKIAYDEDFARYSPGVQVLLHLTEGLLADPQVEFGDSCATANHPMIDHLWRERLPLADRLISIGPGSKLSFSIAATLETARRGAMDIAKKGRGLLRAR